LPMGVCIVSASIVIILCFVESL